MVCGRILLAVSGSSAARRPEVMVGTPRTMRGSGCQYLDSIPMKEAQRLKILETMEQVPMAWARRLVGKSSFV
jgi:hypothetical protein